MVEPGEPLGDGKIYDANGTLLESALRQAGLAVTRAGISADSPEGLRTLLRTHTSAVDLIVTTGGVSKGAYEVVRQAMDGQDVAFQHVAMQPGGPQGLGTFDGVPLLAFPGNPVSCLVSFEMFLRPVLGELFGAPAPRPAVRARLAQPLSSPAGKHQVRRGSLQADGTVRLQGGESSHLVQALAHSNALVHVPVGICRSRRGRRSGSMDVVTAENDHGALTHLRRDGTAQMVDVSGKPETTREATATATVRSTAEVLALLGTGGLPKGDALAVARVAGIMAAKKTPELIPLCHPLPISKVTVDFELGPETVDILATVKTRGVTGVEMEALTAASVAALSVYDMIKAVDKHAVLTDIKVLAKSGGKSGDWAL